FLHHATMEPMNCTAHVRADGCDVWAPTQNQTRAQEVTAELAGLPKETVRIHTTFLGGGFGRRLEPDFVSEAVRVSQAVGAPVKVIWTREDDVRHGFYRPASHNRFAAGLDGAGNPNAWSHRVAAPPILLKFGPLEKGLGRTLLADRPRHRRVLDLAADKAAWGTPLPAGRGRGIALAEWEPTVCAQVAEVTVESDGSVRVHRVVCAVDCGPTVNVGQIEAQM